MNLPADVRAALAVLNAAGNFARVTAPGFVTVTPPAVAGWRAACRVVAVDDFMREFGDTVRRLNAPALESLRQYQPGTYAGFPASFLRHYSEGMVELRLSSGVACVAAADFIVEPAGCVAKIGNGSHSYDVEINRAGGYVTAYAANRAQAAKRVEAAGFEVRSVNMAG